MQRASVGGGAPGAALRRPKKGLIFREDGSRLFMADGKLLTMSDVNREIHRRVPVLDAQDAPERLGSIILSSPMRLPTRWSPTRTKRAELRASSPIKTGNQYYIKDSEVIADAWPLINHDSVTDKYIEISKRYDRFICGGLKSKTGVNTQPAPDEITRVRFKDTYMPSIAKIDQTRRLQEGVFIENERVNKLDSSPLRRFAGQTRPHHMPRTRTVAHAFPGYVSKADFIL